VLTILSVLKWAYVRACMRMCNYHVIVCTCVLVSRTLLTQHTHSLYTLLELKTSRRITDEPGMVSMTMERLICLIGLFFCSLSSNGMPFCTKDKSSCTKSRSLSTFKRLLWSNCKSSCTFWGCPAENIYRYGQKTSR